MALQNSLRSAMITKLIASTGVYPYDPLTICRNCETCIGDLMLRSIINKLQKNELFEEDFKAGICDYGGKTMKNSLVIYQH